MRTFLAFFCTATTSMAGVADLIITEVVPSTGQVEVTNLGNAFTVSQDLHFSHRNTTTDVIPTGTQFAEDEAKVFSVNLSNPTDSDLWLYQVPNFNNANDILSGLKWGPADNVGRENLATSGGKWDGSLLTTPAAGASLQYVKKDPISGGSWVEAVPSLGQYPDPAKEISIIFEGTNPNDAGQLTWTGGTEPFMVQERTNTNNLDEAGWTDAIQNPTENRSINIQFEGRQFFRILSNQEDLNAGDARYRVTLRGLWSTDNFLTVPNGARFTQVIGAMHNTNVEFWVDPISSDPFAPVQPTPSPASNAVKQLAETGAILPLLQEIFQAINLNQASRLIAMGGPNATGSVSTTFIATADFPYVTILSKLSPSPDWFVGTSTTNLRDPFGIGWESVLTVPLYAYDAGTDSGDTFTADNEATTPPENISRIPEDDANFLPPSGNPGFGPVQIGELEFTRIN